MNPTVQRYLPPALVLGAAFYFGWPPPAPLDLGNDVARATSVRWRPDDLADPAVIKPMSDPFQAVLVVSEELEHRSELDIPAPPKGPDAQLLRAGLQLDGIANMGGRNWAVLNGRPQLAGDFVYTGDVNRHRCEIVSVQTDHIVVRCEQTVTEIRPRPSGTARPPESTPIPANGAPNMAPPLDAPPPVDPPPPQA